jgi:hypothetical protein
VRQVLAALLLFLVAALAGIEGEARAAGPIQGSYPTTILSSGPLSPATAPVASTFSSAGLVISGTFTGLVGTIQGSPGDAAGTWTNLPAYNVSTGTIVPAGTTITGTGVWVVPVTGMGAVRFNPSALSTGSAIVTWRPTTGDSIVGQIQTNGPTATVGCPGAVAQFVAACNASTPTDQTVIQTAISSLVSGGTVQILPGTYYLGAAISAALSTTLEGSGIGATTLYVANGISDNAVNCKLTSGWFVKNLSVNGNYANQVNGGANDSKQNDIRFDGCAYSGVDMVETYGAYAHGIFENDVDGSGHDNTYTNWWSHNNGQLSVHLHADSAGLYTVKHIVISDGHSWNNALVSNPFGVATPEYGGIYLEYQGNSEIAVSNIVAHDETGPCYTLSGTNVLSTTQAKSNTFNNIVAYNCGTAGVAYPNASGILFQKQLTNTVISNLVVDTTNSYCLAFDGSSGTVTTLTLSDVLLSGCGAAGVRLTNGVTNTNFDDVSILSPAGDCFLIQNNSAVTTAESGIGLFHVNFQSCGGNGVYDPGTYGADTGIKVSMGQILSPTAQGVLIYASAQTSGPLLDLSVDHLTISNPLSYGVRLIGTGTEQVQSAKIEHNTIALAPVGGVVCSYCYDPIIDGNQFVDDTPASATTGQAISNDHLQRATVANNKTVAVNRSASTATQFQEDANSYGNVYSGNECNVSSSATCVYAQGNNEDVFDNWSNNLLGMSDGSTSQGIRFHDNYYIRSSAGTQHCAHHVDRNTNPSTPSTYTCGGSASLPVATLTSNGELGGSLPAGAIIVGIQLHNTTANAVTGGVQLGTSAGLSNILSPTVVGANANIILYPSANASITAPTTTAAENVYLSAVSAFNSASINATITYATTNPDE